MIWWTESWNPIVGCTPISPACANCYAEKGHTKRHKAYLAGKLQNMPCYSTPFSTVRFLPERLDAPLHWRKPQRIFVCNMGDLFHPDVPDTWLDRIFAVMALCPQHEFMVLTKRPGRMQEYLNFEYRRERIFKAADESDAFNLGWPFGNVRFGATVWDQPSIDEAAKHLLKMPTGARLFLSVEPMLGPVIIPADLLARLSWVICGGETGKNARPMHPDWPRSLRDQCVAAGVPFMFKQWGEWAPWDFERTEGGFNKTNGRDHYKVDSYGRGEPKRLGKAKAGRVLDGRTWEEVPHAS
ncbi:MAG: phage Gp37/Gp68 family protein [Humidesulfovibrio sp.]